MRDTPQSCARHAIVTPERGPVNEMSNPDVAIRAWSAADLELLERLLGDPAAMQHLGGAEAPDAIRARHERYLAADPESHGVFAVVLGPLAEPIGWVGYWESEWRGETVWECGWHVLCEHHGCGVATAAASLMLDSARLRRLHRCMHALPSVDNIASNALCRTLGFTLLGEVEVEYPVGRMMRSNDWRLDLDRLIADTRIEQNARR